MDKQNSEKRFALLIDADNVSAKYIKPITDELSNYGTVTIKRIYGDWTLSLHAKWKDALLENSLTPIQQFSYTTGKNATDSAMIIDAMDILYTGSVDGFCIVSSDSDFTRLASRLRESGRMVIGMGEKKTPTPFRRACDVFTTLELLLDDTNGKRKDRGGAESGPTIREVEQAVVRIITDNQNNGKATGLGEVGSRLLKRFPDFDVRSYGTNLLSKLLSKFQSVKITKSGSDVSVELADDKDLAKKKDQREAEQSEKPVDQASGQAAESAEAEPGAVETEQPAEEAEAEERRPSQHRRKRRGGSRRRSRGGAAAERREDQAEPADARRTDVPPAAEGEEQPADAVPAPEGQPQGESQLEEREAAAEASQGHSGQAAVEEPAPGKAARRKGNRKAPSKAATKPAAEQPQKEGKATPPEVDSTTRRIVADAGTNGIEISELASQVRGKHRGFKVRDYGYAQFKAYVAHLDDIEVERIGKEWFARMAD